MFAVWISLSLTRLLINPPLTANGSPSPSGIAGRLCFFASALPARYYSSRSTPAVWPFVSTQSVLLSIDPVSLPHSCSVQKHLASYQTQWNSDKEPRVRNAVVRSFACAPSVPHGYSGYMLARQFRRFPFALRLVLLDYNAKKKTVSNWAPVRCPLCTVLHSNVLLVITQLSRHCPCLHLPNPMQLGQFFCKPPLIHVLVFSHQCPLAPQSPS